jgi:hypothetical protein
LKNASIACMPHPGPKRSSVFASWREMPNSYRLARSHAGGGDRYQSYGSVGAAQFSVADIHT